MIQVDSYFLKPNVFIGNQEITSKQLNQYFINVNDREKLSKQIPTTHPVYPGMIEIKYGLTTVLGIAYTDSVDSLWFNIIKCLNLLSEQQEGTAPLIYLPFELALTIDPNNSEIMIISVIRYATTIQSWSLPKYKTIHALLDGAKVFFEQLKELNFNIIVNDTEDILDTISKLKIYFNA